MSFMNAKIHHVNVTVPKSKEEAAKHFYGVVLGLNEVPKPQESRGISTRILTKAPKSIPFQSMA